MSGSQNKVTENIYPVHAPNEPSDKGTPPTPSPASPPPPPADRPASQGGGYQRDPIPPRAQRERQR